MNVEVTAVITSPVHFSDHIRGKKELEEFILDYADQIIQSSTIKPIITDKNIPEKLFDDD